MLVDKNRVCHIRPITSSITCGVLSASLSKSSVPKRAAINKDLAFFAKAKVKQGLTNNVLCLSCMQDVPKK